MATVDYVPPRGTVVALGRQLRQPGRPLPGRRRLPRRRSGRASSWRAATTPALVLAAWDWRDGKLTQRWMFDRNSAGNQRLHRAGQPPALGRRRGRRRQGRDRLRRARPSTTTAGAVEHRPAATATPCTSATSTPDRPGLEVCAVPRGARPATATYGLECRDARTGKALWGVPGDAPTSAAAWPPTSTPATPADEVWGSVGGAACTCTAGEPGRARHRQLRRVVGRRPEPRAVSTPAGTATPTRRSCASISGCPRRRARRHAKRHAHPPAHD